MPTKSKSALSSFIYDTADEDHLTLLKAVLAEFLCMTLFLFFTIGTISSTCHTADNLPLSGAADKSLVGGELYPVHMAVLCAGPLLSDVRGKTGRV
jgi:hypothetical protein